MHDVEPSISVYVEETRELLSELERGLLELEKTPADMDRVDACFRAMHTIKGGGAMFGFEEISRFTHNVETIFDRVRAGDLPVTKELLTLTFAAKDHILALLEVPGQASPELRAASEALLEAFAAFMPVDAAHTPPPGPPDAAPAGDACTAQQAGPPGIYWIRFRPSSRILHSGNDPVRLLADMDTLGLMRVLRQGVVPDLDDPAFQPEESYCVFDILIRTPCGLNSLSDVFIFVESESDIVIERIHEGPLRGGDLDDLLRPLVGLDAAPPEIIQETLSGALNAKLNVISAAKARNQAKQRLATDAAKPRSTAASASSTTLRVDAARLDSVISMVGELVILQSRLRQAVRARDFEAAAAVDEDLERLTDTIRDVALGLRMLPIGTVFSQFTRLLRDLSSSLGKEVDFETRGGDTELDKTVIDRMKDPLIHLLRNSLDHGVEAPEARKEAGKSPRGHITLAASHSGGNVVISITDDGRGIDPVAVRRKAIERGLMAPDVEPSEQELFNCIFLPGFSTASQISDISGRGVGMDVVKSNIEALRGTVEVESIFGKGTTVTIRLPLTLAIIDGFNVQVGKDSFIVPLVNLRGFQERFVTGDVRTVETLERMGDLIPVVSLRSLFAVPGAQPEYERVVITEVEGEIVGFCVDKVVGRQQAVIKSLNDCYRHLKWISGTTINGDGSISLILDVPQLIRFVRGQEETRLHGTQAFRTLA